MHAHTVPCKTDRERTDGSEGLLCTGYASLRLMSTKRAPTLRQGLLQVPTMKQGAQETGLGLPYGGRDEALCLCDFM